MKNKNDDDIHARLTRLVDENLGTRPNMSLEMLISVLETELPALIRERDALLDALDETEAVVEAARAWDRLWVWDGPHDGYEEELALHNALKEIK